MAGGSITHPRLHAAAHLVAGDDPLDYNEVAQAVADIGLLQSQNSALDGWVEVRKSADESVSASTVLQNDDHLSFVAAAGVAYYIEAQLIYASPVGAGTPDLKVAIGEDATARGVLHTVGSFSAADAAADATLLADKAATVVAGTAAAKRVLALAGSIVGNGGTFRVLWAQNTSNANPVTVYAGSRLRYRPLS